MESRNSLPLAVAMHGPPGFALQRRYRRAHARCCSTDASATYFASCSRMTLVSVELNCLKSEPHPQRAESSVIASGSWERRLHSHANVACILPTNQAAPS